MRLATGWVGQAHWIDRADQSTGRQRTRCSPGFPPKLVPSRLAPGLAFAGRLRRRLAHRQSAVALLAGKPRRVIVVQTASLAAMDCRFVDYFVVAATSRW